MAGIPTMAVTRSGFSRIVANALAGLGFYPEAPCVYEFPMDMFIPDSDLTPIAENIDKIIYGLTKWEPEITEEGIYYPADNIAVEGKDYQEAVDNMNKLFLRNYWSDGLPLTPATVDRVNWILRGTDLPKDEVIGVVTPRGGIATVRGIAIALAMAGGRPEYLPVLIANVQAMTSTGPSPGTDATNGAFYLQGWSSTTQPVWPLFIVNGPIGKQIRLSSGYGLMGPDPAHPAASCIGRAVRIILQDLGGSLPGMGDMKVFSPAMATNMVIAEDEEGLPPGWEPFSVEQRGFAKGENVVTAMTINGVTRVSQTNKDLSTDSLKRTVGGIISGDLATTVRVVETTPERADKNAPTGLLLMPRLFPQTLVSTLGYTKQDVKEYLWDATKNEAGADGKVAYRMNNADQFQIVVAGGEQSGHILWLRAGMGQDVVSKPITLPAAWDELLAEAEEDLGPLPPW
jgi:hypothetical protein